MVAQTIPEDRPLTVDDFMSLPMVDTRIVELLQGELILAPSPELNHQRIARRLVVRLDAIVERTGFGELFFAPTAVVLSKNDVVEPDLFVIRSDQQSLATQHTFNDAPPIVFEVLSPSNRKIDLQRKALLYANAGVEEYWMVDAEKRRILVQRLVDGNVDTAIFTAGSVTSAILPEFTVVIDEIFS
jgi:Uma2 family endonuclease